MSISTREFKQLMQTVADGWNEGNARKAANCFHKDAVYVEPPDKQLYHGRAELHEFFGGDKGPDTPMKMIWHHLAFDEEEQVGFGEYTFQMHRRYHGIVVVKKVLYKAFTIFDFRQELLMLRDLRRWFGPPSFEGDEDKTRAATLLNIILWILIAAALVYGLFAPIDPLLSQRRIAIIASLVAVLVFFKLLVNRGHVYSTGTLTVFVLWLLITGALLIGADPNNPAFMGYLVVVVCAGLILNWRASIAWSVTCILASAAILLLRQRNLLPSSELSVPPITFWITQTVYILTSTVLLSLAIHKIDEAFARAQRELNERKRVEAEREKVIKELEAKNAELERFTYTVSHDLKSPLITISGFVGLLEADAKAGNTEKFKADLTRINEATAKMKRLLDELLELSRIGRLVNPPSDTPFDRIVEEALFMVRGRLRAGNIDVHVQEDLPLVRGDHPRLVEVLQNLIDNAAKFMGDQPAPRIEIGMRAEEKECVFFVRDNGIGIEPAHHERVFGLFDKLDPRSEGTGVGLALAKRIVEVHGGQLWLESEGRGRGSMFCFTLPIKE